MGGRNDLKGMQGLKPRMAGAGNPEIVDPASAFLEWILG
jgi:hypothetical protein